MSMDDVGAGLLGGGGLIGAIGSIIEGNARADALDLEAKQAQTRGKQEQVARLDDLQRTLGAIAALTGQRGISPQSPSAEAYAAGVEEDAYRNIRRARGNAEAEAASMRSQAGITRTTGYITAASKFANSAAKAASMFA